MLQNIWSRCDTPRLLMKLTLNRLPWQQTCVYVILCTPSCLSYMYIWKAMHNSSSLGSLDNTEMYTHSNRIMVFLSTLLWDAVFPEVQLSHFGSPASFYAICVEPSANSPLAASLWFLKSGKVMFISTPQSDGADGWLWEPADWNGDSCRHPTSKVHLVQGHSAKSGPSQNESCVWWGFPTSMNSTWLCLQLQPYQSTALL